MKYLKILLFCLLLIISCSTHENEKIISNDAKPDKNILSVKIMKNCSIRKQNFNIASYNNDLYCSYYQNNKYYFYKVIVKDNNLNYDELLFTCNQGKGPMDIMSLNGFSIKNNKIYTYDSNLKRISIFNFNGKNLDVINLNNYISDLAISKNKIFITGFIKNNLEVIDLKTGNQIKKIKYAEIEKLTDRGYGKMGPICYDKNSKKIYRGYWEEPYRIKIYNRDIKLKNVIKKDLDHNISEFERTENKGFIGKFLIKDLAIYKDYLVALEGSCGYIDDKKRKWRIDKFKINVFNKNTGKYIYEITNDKLSNLGAFINGIIDINNKYIIFELKQIKETNKLLDIKTDSALIFVENPLNNYEQKNN